MSLTIVGVDPGLVNTGLVRITFDPQRRSIERQWHVVDGLGMQEAAGWIRLDGRRADEVFVEKYRPRHNLHPDQKMLDAQKELKQLVPEAVLLENTGVVKTVTRGLLEILGLWDAPQRTHHQDLKSAARILVKGMMMGKASNALLADVVLAHLEEESWSIDA